jgi:hypothetical protein
MESKTKTRRFVVVAIDGFGRWIEILKAETLEARNPLHFKLHIKAVETEANEKTTTLKANAYAAIKVVPVTTFRNIDQRVSPIAAGLNAVKRRAEQKRMDNTQAFLAKKKRDDARKEAEAERAEAAKTALVRYVPTCTAIVKV